MLGIDVSDWQGDVDFSKVKATGYVFVIPREGRRELPDEWFFRNVPKIQAAGLQLPGVYHFIYATDADGAAKEAMSCIANVEKAGLPKSTILWADWEYDSVDKAKAAGINLTAKQQREITEAFCKTAQDAGYPTGIYLNADFLLNVFGKDIAQEWDIWLADWSGDADYPCLYHQTSDKGTVSGVSGHCDTDKFIGTYTAGTAKPKGGESVSNKCTAAEAVKAMEYYIGYYEKASIKYSYYREKSYFEKDEGSNNYTYAGYVCGVNGQPWCAAQVSTAILDACGGDKDAAKEVMFGVWPYVNCAQLWDAGNNNEVYWSYYQRWTLGKGDRTTYTPVAGDVIVFTDDKKTRSHTGMVYSCDGTYVYTIEGNSGQMCRKRSYLLTSSYIYGYVKPRYKKSDVKPDTPVEQYGKVVFENPELHLLSKGCAGPEVKVVQCILRGYGITDDDNKVIEVDGDYGKSTEQAVKKVQRSFGWDDSWIDGKVGKYTWPKLLNDME